MPGKTILLLDLEVIHSITLRLKPINYMCYTLREKCWLNCSNFKLYVDYTKTMNAIKGSYKGA